MIRTLKLRLSLFLLLPVAFMLFVTGYAGFFLAKRTIMEEWKEAAIVKLQRAAHHMDMRLNRPMEWIEMFHEVGGRRDNAIVPQWFVDRLKNLEGVTGVDLQWISPAGGAPSPMNGPRQMMHAHRSHVSQVTPPRFDAQAGHETVSLVSELKDESDQIIGRLSVTLRFDYLMQDIISLGWWQSEMVCLVDHSGRYFAHTGAWMKERRFLGETDDPLELKVLESIRERPFGTVLGAGDPPKMVSGFYSLSKAPWVIVLFAPGEKILAPVLNFRLYYALAGFFCVAVILTLIHLVGSRWVGTIKRLSGAAESVAQGVYGDPLPANRSDEMGQLVESFNKMVEGLKERDFISNTFGRYVDPEIARELLKRPEAARLGGEKREVAMLISDLRNFTPLSESLTPEQTIQVLNRYFSRMIDVARNHRGIIVDFFGDSLLIFFEPMESDMALCARRAVDCAKEMQEELFRYNMEARALKRPELDMGIGVHVGEVVVGNIGSTTRTKYGIVGSPVNITQRIQAIASAGQIVLSESAYNYLGGRVAAEPLAPVTVKGIPAPLNVFVVKTL